MEKIPSRKPKPKDFTDKEVEAYRDRERARNEKSANSKYVLGLSDEELRAHMSLQQRFMNDPLFMSVMSPFSDDVSKNKKIQKRLPSSKNPHKPKIGGKN